MARLNRGEIARRLTAFIPTVIMSGVRHPATSQAPTHTTFETGRVSWIFTQGVLRSPEEGQLSCLLDVYHDNRKVASLVVTSVSLSGRGVATWMPAAIVSMKNGDWLLDLEILEKERQS